MAVGDVVSDIQIIANNAFLDLQPAGAIEWVIHNIYHDNDVELYFYDNVDDLLFDSETGSGHFAYKDHHCTNTTRVRIKNVSGGNALIGYDGVVTK